MPGGLASWLDDESNSRKSKLPSTATAAHDVHRERKASQVVSVIDVDAASPDAAVARGEKASNTPLQASAGKPAWDPFSSNSARVDAREDAFARLRQGAAAAKQQPTTPTTTASTPSPPTWRRESPPSSSSWDPFASTADGKENRENAFSKLLAAPCQQHSSHKGRSLVGGGGSSKRAKPSAPTAMAAGLGGTASEAGAVTRFCECPVCGKRVIIELCSKHLDTECGGPDVDAASTPVPALDKPRPLGPLPPARFTSASSLLMVSDAPSPCQQPASGIPVRSFGSPVGGQKGTGEDSRALSPSTSALPATDASDGPRKTADRSSAGAEGESDAFRRAAGSPLASAAVTAAPAAAAAAAAVKPAASTRKRTARGAPSSSRQGGKRAAATAAAAEARGMTTCPVCGKQVHADRCSWHLDNDCAGVNPAPAPLPSCEGKSAGGVGVGQVKEGVAEGRGADGGDGVPKKDAGGDTAGGMNALVAELTCPVCLCVFEDVHSLPCSHRFCLECIMGCFKSSKRQECPLCKIPAWKRDLTRDVPLHNIIIAYRRMAA